MRATEACGGREAPEPTQRIGPPLEVAVILLHPVSEIASAALHDLPAERFADGAGVGVVSIRGHAVRSVAHWPTTARAMCKKR